LNSPLILKGLKLYFSTQNGAGISPLSSRSYLANMVYCW